MEMTEADREEIARALPCETCGAQPGRRCTDLDDQPLPGAHPERLDLIEHGGEVNGVAWTNKEVAAYGNVVKDNNAAGSNSPTPEEWKDQQADKRE